MNCSSKNSFTSKRTALNWITFQLNFAEFIMRLMKWNTWARIYICRCWRCKICVLNLFMLFFSPLVKVRWKNSLCSAEKSRFSLAYFFFVSSFNFRKNSLFFSNKIRFCALFSIDEHEICCLFLSSFFCYGFFCYGLYGCDVLVFYKQKAVLTVKIFNIILQIAKKSIF